MENRKTERKWFFVWDFEKEEQWLNDQAAAGWVLERVAYATYTFVRCQPGEYAVRLEMHDTDDGYIDFMEEAGAEYVGRVLQWVYFRKKTEEGGFDLFSDIDSRIAHLARIAKMLFCIGMGNLALGIGNSIGASHAGWVNLLCSTLLMYGLGRIHGMKLMLERERALHE